ncbi:MAG TPA: hypothetical protein VJ820_18170, partial [Propionibacteriaceae bacterium]|nr:hypothetical protein [Propionibacteriaceae bacterium]
SVQWFGLCSIGLPAKLSSDVSAGDDSWPVSSHPPGTQAEHVPWRGEIGRWGHSASPRLTAMDWSVPPPAAHRGHRARLSR